MRVCSRGPVRRTTIPTELKGDRADAGRFLIPLAADEDFDNRVVRGVLREEPDVDIVRVQDAGLSGHDDPDVLRWAESEERVLLSHDTNTMTKYAYQRIKEGKPMPGLWVVPRDLQLGDVITDVCIVATLSNKGEYDSQVRYLPLR